MAAAPPPASAPAAPPAASAPPSRPPPQPREGVVVDQGTVRKDSVDAGRWTARGTVKVTGDVLIEDGELDGSVSVGGKLTASTLRAQGMLDVEGAVDVSGSFTNSGNFHAAGSLHAGEANLRGTVRVLGSVSVDRVLTVHGSLSAPSLTTGAATLEGEAQVPGDVVGQSVAARLRTSSTFGTIRARTVSLRAKVPNLVEKILFHRVDVRAQRVEAETADLEGVSVAFVRAPKIVLGREAHVTEYEGTIVRRHPSSRVGFESKSPPPYGLRR